MSSEEQQVAAAEVAEEARRDGERRGERGDRPDDGERRRDDDRERRRDHKEKRERSRSRSRERRSSRRERSRSHDRSRERRRRSRSRSRDRRRRHSRSRSRDRRRSERERSERERDERRGGGGGGYRGRRGRDSDDDYGYVPRRRGRGSPGSRDLALALDDPFAKLRQAHAVATDPAEAARQMQEAQLKARQLVLVQQAASAVAAASKTQREVYVGNLTPGMVTADMLRTLFSSTLSVAFPEMCANGQDPVVLVSLHSEGRYAFVELRTLEMATASLQLNAQVSLLGQVLSVGRPSGYVDPGKAAHAALVAAEALARFQAESQALRAQQGGLSADELAAEDSCYLVIDGMISAGMLEEEKEYDETLADLHGECTKHGTVLRVVVPRPPVPAEAGALMGQGQIGRAFVQFLEPEGARRAKDALDGRVFAGNEVRVAFLQPQPFIDAITAPPPPGATLPAAAAAVAAAMLPAMMMGGLPGVPTIPNVIPPVPGLLPGMPGALPGALPGAPPAALPSVAPAAPTAGAAGAAEGAAAAAPAEAPAPAAAPAEEAAATEPAA